VNPNKNYIDGLSSDIRSKIEQYNHEDLEFYRQAKQWLENRWKNLTY